MPLAGAANFGRRVDAAVQTLDRVLGRGQPPSWSPLQLAEAAGIVPDPWQAAVLTSTAPRVLLNCSRQAGKSTTTALLALHTALYEPGSLVVLISRSQRQSAELFRRAADVYRRLGRPVPEEAESVLKLELQNGSRILSLPGRDADAIRGFSSVTLMVIDEAARVPDALYLSCRPMLAVSGGRLIALSTPHGNRGWFYTSWTGPEAWERYEVPATDCPRIAADFLEEERRTLGEWWYAQEYLCQFMDAQSSLFRTVDIDAAFDGAETWAL